MNNLPLIISFYTNDWVYPDYANALKKDCEGLNLDYHIVEKPSTGDYIQNTSIKPYFVQECIRKFNRPLLWIDCDGSILNLPILLESHNVKNFDFAAKKYAGPVERAWHVGTLWFNNSQQANIFVDDWCSLSGAGTDENSFENAWIKNKDQTKVYELPSEYFTILTKRNPDPPHGTVIVHRLSQSPDKIKRKYSAQQEPTQ